MHPDGYTYTIRSPVYGHCTDYSVDRLLSLTSIVMPRALDISGVWWVNQQQIVLVDFAASTIEFRVIRSWADQ